VYSTQLRLFVFDRATNAYAAAGGGGLCGCVVVGGGTNYTLLVYDAQKQHLCACVLDGAFTLAVQPNLYVSFTSPSGEAWSVHLASAAQLEGFCKHVVATCAHVAQHSGAPLAATCLQVGGSGLCFKWVRMSQRSAGAVRWAPRRTQLRRGPATRAASSTRPGGRCRAHFFSGMWLLVQVLSYTLISRPISRLISVGFVGGYIQKNSRAKLPSILALIRCAKCSRASCRLSQGPSDESKCEPCGRAGVGAGV
jgi:hypothetical protein